MRNQTKDAIKNPKESVFRLIIVLLAGAIFISGSPFFEKVEADLSHAFWNTSLKAEVQSFWRDLFEVSAKQGGFGSVPEQEMPLLSMSQDNSLFSFSSPHFVEPVVIRRIPVIATGYSSSPFETDESPFITAAGTTVRRGVVANNLLPFGTKIRMPEIYQDEIFVVEDRMHWRKSYYQIDIWFPSYEEALNFGVRQTYVEIIAGS